MKQGSDKNSSSANTALEQWRKQVLRKKKIKNARTLVRISLATMAAAVFAVLFLMPIVLTITNSFMSASEISANYGQVFATTDSGGKMYISEKVNLIVPIVGFQLLVAAGAAFGFTRYRGRVKEMIFFIYIILMLMPYQVTLVPNYLVSKWLHVLDTNWAIWLPGIFSPFAVYLLTKYMRRIPVSMMEAAQIDGAGELQIFRKICMPLCKGAMCSIAILIFIDYWNMVEQPLILLSDAEKHPLSVFLSKINAGEIGLAFAVATIYMVPPILVFLYGEDYLVEGITYQGGIKG